MLIEAEIKKIKEGAVIITLEDALRLIATGQIKVIPPTSLNNGCRVGYSITFLRPDLDVHHISVSNSKGVTDPAEAECIARDILGEGYKALGPMNLKNVLHFMKFVEKKEEVRHH